MVVRYRTPFAPEFNFIVKRPFTVDGRDYAVGEEFDKANVNVRLLQKLYEQHKLDAVIPSFTIRKDAEEAEAEPAPQPKEKPAKPKRKAEATVAAPAPEQPAVEAPVAAGGEAPQYRVEPAFGGVKLVGPSGVVGKFKTREEAEAAMAGLSEG